MEDRAHSCCSFDCSFASCFLFALSFSKIETLHKLFKILSLWLPLGIYLGVIYYFSSLSQPKLGLLSADFPLHMIEYCILSLLIFRAMNFGFKKKASINIILLSLILSIVYAVLDEIHQSYVPNRTPSYMDLLADSFGALLGMAGIIIYQRGFLYRKMSNGQKNL
jgi:hypothetical protein